MVVGGGAAGGEADVRPVSASCLPSHWRVLTRPQFPIFLVSPNEKQTSVIPLTMGKWGKENYGTKKHVKVRCCISCNLQNSQQHLGSLPLAASVHAHACQSALLNARFGFTSSSFKNLSYLERRRRWWPSAPRNSSQCS